MGRQQPLERIEESEKNAYWKELGRIGKNKLSQQEEEEETEKDTNKAHLQWEQRHIGSGHSNSKKKSAFISSDTERQEQLKRIEALQEKLSQQEMEKGKSKPDPEKAYAQWERMHF